MNDNDNANMYEIFERLNRVQSRPSKLEEAATKHDAVDEAVRGTVFGKQGYRAPQTQDERNRVAQTIKGNRAQNRADTRVTGYGNKVAPQRGVSSADTGGARGSAVNVDQTGQATDFEPGIGNIDPQAQGYRGALTLGKRSQGKGVAEEGGTPMTPKQKSFAKLAAPADKITFADKIAGAKQEVDEMLGDVAADAIKKAISTHKGGKVSGGKGVTRHTAGTDVYGGSAPDKGHAVDRMKGPSDKALGGKEYKVKEGSPKKKTQSPDEQHKVVAGVRDAMRKGYDNVQKGRDERAAARFVAKLKYGSNDSKKTDEDFPTVADAEKRLRDKEGKTTKGTVTKTATGMRHTRDYEHDVGADDEKSSSGEKRSAGRPKKYTDDAPRQERVTAKSRKTDRTAHGQAGFKKDKVKENNVDIVDQGEYDQEGDMAKNDIKTIVRHAQALHKILGDSDNLPEWVQSKLAKIEAMMISVDEYMQNQDDKEGQEPVAEKAVSKKQQRFMGMVHAAQKGEKPASKEVGKVAKTMKNKDAEDFAKTKHKGLPEKAKAKKKEESVEETTTSGSVAAAPGTGNSKGGMSFGKGIYDSVDRKVEAIIAESMSINMSTSTEGDQTMTVTASDEDAMKLASLLKMAGIGSGDAGGSCDSCGESPCGCDHVDENAPDWPTNKEYNSDALQYAGGLNKPKETGQTTAPVFSRDARRQHTPENDELARIMEIAGIKETAGPDEGTKPDFLDMDKDGDKKEPMKKAVKDKDEEKKVEESIFALTNQWRAFKG